MKFLKVVAILLLISLLAIGCSSSGGGNGGSDGGGGVMPDPPAEITRVSVDSHGIDSNDGSENASISADGRFVAFDSSADNLVANDTNTFRDIFVHDRQTNQTTIVSVDSSGGAGNHSSEYPSISADGRYVAFSSIATNLVANSSNKDNIFVHDRQTGQTTIISVDSNGVAGNNESLFPSISADGRYVAFESWADNLVANDTNSYRDIFVHDRETGQTTRISVDSNGIEGNDFSRYPSISADGRYVAFESWADNLVANDTNAYEDIFVHDLQTSQTTRVSIDSNGVEGDGWSEDASISADGRYVAFSSIATNLVSIGSYTRNIFVHDRQTAHTTIISVDSNGVACIADSFNPSISADGRFVAFESWASNLVTDDTNTFFDIFVHDRQTGQTSRINVDSNGVESNNMSQQPSISADGRYVAFESLANNLVANDTNSEKDVFLAPAKW